MYTELQIIKFWSRLSGAHSGATITVAPRLGFPLIYSELDEAPGRRSEGPISVNQSDGAGNRRVRLDDNATQDGGNLGDWARKQACARAGNDKGQKGLTLGRLDHHGGLCGRPLQRVIEQTASGASGRRSNKRQRGEVS